MDFPSCPRCIKCCVLLLNISVCLITIRLTHTNVWQSVGKPCSCTQFTFLLHVQVTENPYQYYKSRKNPYQVLQVIVCVRCVLTLLTLNRLMWLVENVWLKLEMCRVCVFGWHPIQLMACSTASTLRGNQFIYKTV